MEQDGPIEQIYFLAALEDGGTFSADYRVVYGRPDVIPAKNEAEAADRSFARFISGSSAAPESGAELVSSLLRAYTDEWLETGIDVEGKESPFTRKLTDAGVVWAAVRKHEYDVSWGGKIDWDNGIERSPISLASKLSLTVTSDREPLFPAGGRSASTLVQPPPKPSTKTPLPGTGNMPENVVEAAKLRAVILFHAFMKAPWRYRLGKCKRCQAYFVLKVNPSKSPYARGMHCSRCKSLVSADVSAKAKRAEREQKLLGLAAEKWSEWRSTPQFGERNEWIAKRVNASLGKKEIQRNWVTRHEKEIIAMQRKNRESTPVSGTNKLTGQITRFRGAARNSVEGIALPKSARLEKTMLGKFRKRAHAES